MVGLAAHAASAHPTGDVMNRVLSLILGGGRGTRLFPLTKSRSKPAMPLAGRYRLIDIPISNCINSGLSHIYVLTQFLSASLHRHIGNTYKFDMFDRGFCEILAAQQTYENADWYQGTADAIRQNMRYVHDNYDEVLILSGDQLYRMDYGKLLKTHRTAGADVTIGVLPVDKSVISGFGLVKVGDDGRITGFIEKPKTEAAAAPFRAPADWLKRQKVDVHGREYVANMGIYVFKRPYLEHVLNAPLVGGKPPTDFGKDIFPNIYKDRHVHAHVFDGFWEDLGTIRSYWEVSLALCDDQPTFEFHSPEGIIYTRVRNLPPSRVSAARFDKVRIAEGCVIQPDVEIRRGIVGVRSRICRGTRISDTVIIGADLIECDAARAENARTGKVDLGIGENSLIKSAIIDKDCRIGRNVHIENDTGIDFENEESDKNALYYIRDGIVVIPRGATIPDGMRIPLKK
jgi:glucose-1-phosphate adenylyltransferase